MKCRVPVVWLVVTGRVDGVVLEADGSDVGRNTETDQISVSIKQMHTKHGRIKYHVRANVYNVEC